MESNVTIGSRVFNYRSSSEKNGVFRADASTGVNTPTTLNVKQQRFVDSESKLPAHLSAIRLELPVAVQNGTKLHTASVTLTLRCPVDSTVDYSDVSPLLAVVKDLLASTALTESVFKERGV